MGRLDFIGIFLQRAARGAVMHPSHYALFMALSHLGNGKRTGEWFRITRKELMGFSGIRSRSTYHRCLADLVRKGFIYYEPSYNPVIASRVMIIDL
jgi:hypothetical protein